MTLFVCPTNSTPGLVKVSELIVGQAIPPVSSLASEVFIPISEKLQGILTNLEVAFNPVLSNNWKAPPKVPHAFRRSFTQGKF